MTVDWSGYAVMLVASASHFMLFISSGYWGDVTLSRQARTAGDLRSRGHIWYLRHLPPETAGKLRDQISCALNRNFHTCRWSSDSISSSVEISSPIDSFCSSMEFLYWYSFPYWYSFSILIKLSSMEISISLEGLLSVFSLQWISSSSLFVVMIHKKEHRNLKEKWIYKDCVGN